jgi:MFS family permease
LVNRVVAFPESLRILKWHLLYAAGMGTNTAVIAFLPFLARQHFAASNWQTTVLTAAIPVMQFFSIFWNHLYARASTAGYLTALCFLLSMPIALLGLAGNVWITMALFLVAAFGNAGMSPLNGDLLRSCYAPSIRGRIFGFVSTAQMIASMLTGLMMGLWSERQAEAFRIFLPLIACVQIGGLLAVRRISRKSLYAERLRPGRAREITLLSPFREMLSVLRADRRFAAYEVAFMSYGVGWMICSALIPALATDKLHLNYHQYAQATIVLFQLVNILLFALAGGVVDRIGPMRLATLSFLWLTIYPVGLFLAPGYRALILCSCLYALGMVGVNLTWTLGPVALASDASRASHYLAIHTTMVGIRGIVAQGLGMALYSLTGSFAIPLGMAAVGFLWAAYRMNALSKTWSPDRQA